MLIWALAHAAFATLDYATLDYVQQSVPTRTPRMTGSTSDPVILRAHLKPLLNAHS